LVTVNSADANPPRWFPWAALGVLAVLVFWLRWPTFDFKVWNVDEAIHAAIARTLLDGGVLYRDAVDQRTPLTYYAVAALFRVAGENNIWAMRALASALIVATCAGLFLLGRAWRGPATGLWAALPFAVLSTTLLYPGDAYALNTEWFVAAFTTWAAWLCWRGAFATAGLLLACAFLSKQPALLDLGAPLALLAYVALSGRAPWKNIILLAAGFLAPVAAVAAYFALRGAAMDFFFYAWQYNLQYYGTEIGAADRVASAFKPFLLLWTENPLLLAAAIGAATHSCFRVAQRQPTEAERPGNAKLAHLLVWAAASLAGAASGGRGFDHYYIQFLPACCLLGALGVDGAIQRARRHRAARWLWPAALLAAALILLQLGRGALTARQRPPLPVDPSWRVATYIREHSAPDDRIFVWGYHPDIHLFSDRRPASRFVYASFLSGLIPWTNIAPAMDTAYAIVPGARETLMRELAATRPLFIVDCSPGPNRWWNKYPPDTFPDLAELLRRDYAVVEAGQFVPQGFRLFQRRAPGSQTNPEPPQNELPPELAATLRLGAISSGLEPLRASAPHGASRLEAGGRVEYFMHAPATLVYRLPGGGVKVRGGFGFKPGAYAADNPAPTDGAEFVIRWRPAAGGEQILLRRPLRPREAPDDRGHQVFQVVTPPGGGGELEFAIIAGPAQDATSDWTYWSDLFFETLGTTNK
jgi:hypothetical protein